MAGVRLEFAQFGHFDYFNIYRNSVSTAIDNLGQPIGTSSTMYYEDLTVEQNQNYYYRIGSVKNGVEEISSQIKAYAIPQSSFIFKSPFSVNLVDEAGKTWNAFGGAKIQLQALHIQNNSAVAADYLSTSKSNVNQIFSENDFTMRMKFKLDRATGIHILCSCRSYSEGAGFWLGVVDGSLSFSVYDGSTTETVSFAVLIELNLVDFFRVSIERKSKKYYLYFNDLLIASTAVEAGIRAPSSIISDMNIGVMSDDNRYFLSGYIKDFELLTRALGSGGATTPRF